MIVLDLSTLFEPACSQYRVAGVHRGQSAGVVVHVQAPRLASFSMLWVMQ